MQTITSANGALRLARTIASDILLYNKDKIADGIKRDNLFEVLESEINEGHDLFMQRVAPEIIAQHNFVERAIVDVLIKACADLPTRIW
ncbi:MAG: hypothetical protein KDA97_04860 [Acidimicrobiales bacterium]|nr:hypothetical protein [Acidimicrobiales bacterium]MCB9547650.1 hypothetical protein [Myxococcales bacterium]